MLGLPVVVSEALAAHLGPALALSAEQVGGEAVAAASGKTHDTRYLLSVEISVSI